MIQQQNSSDRLVRFIVLLGEIVLIALMMAALYAVYWHQMGGFPPHFKRLVVLMCLCYGICQLYVGVVVHERFVTGDQILHRYLMTFLTYMLLSLTVLWVFRWPLFTVHFMVPLYAGSFVVVLFFRFVTRRIVRLYRSRGRNTNYAVFVGPLAPIQTLVRKMVADRSTGYTVKGYFADSADASAEELGLEWLGVPGEFAKTMGARGITSNYVYCTLTADHRDEIQSIIRYCEAQMIRYCSIPTAFNYMKHNMSIELIDNIPVLSFHNEPLESTGNRLLKRGFDIVFSCLVLVIVFPVVYLIFGTWIKLSSPGPIFFKQKRSGLGGKEFWCYKFRSMRQSADADTKQATRDDPRKTRVGELMRKTSIDELPQFINVLRGDMSVVGPRPHMLKHTAQYSEIINSYMVRHFVKPGITGYAQVTGYRGETSELWQMEGRVERDIWYIEHWSISLDLFIIYKTIANALCGEDKAY